MKIEEVKIGLQVVYYSVITSSGKKLLPHYTEIVSNPWKAGEFDVVKIKGLSHPVALEYLSPADQTTPNQRIKDAYQAVKFQMKNVKGHINSRGFFAAEVKTECLIKAATHLLNVLNEINDNSQN